MCVVALCGVCLHVSTHSLGAVCVCVCVVVVVVVVIVVCLFVCCCLLRFSYPQTESDKDDRYVLVFAPAEVFFGVKFCRADCTNVLWMRL